MEEAKKLYDYINWLIIGVEDGWIYADSETWQMYKVFKKLMTTKDYRSM